MQNNFIPHFHNYEQLTLNCQWLADLCHSLKVRYFIVEHRELGKRPEALTTAAKEATRLVTDYFDFLQELHIVDHLRKHMKEQYILAGAETHASIFQSAIGLKKKENAVFILADTCSARSEVNHNYGLQRARDNGIQLITREMFFFEMIRTTQDPNYVKLATKFIPSTLDTM
jgi:hypothetical protein